MFTVTFSRALNLSQSPPVGSTRWTDLCRREQMEMQFTCDTGDVPGAVCTRSTLHGQRLKLVAGESGARKREQPFGGDRDFSWMVKAPRPPARGPCLYNSDSFVNSARRRSPRDGAAG